MSLPHGHDAPRSERLKQQVSSLHNAMAFIEICPLPELCDKLATLRVVAFEARREIHNIWDRACEPEGIDLKELGL